MAKKLALKPTARIKTSAEAVISVCAELAAKDQLSAKTMVAVSRPEDAPLHREFEWDNEIAGEKYREEQARSIIRCVVIETDERPNAQPVRAYVNITAEKDGAYRPVDAVLAKRDSRALLMKQARGDMEAFRAKYLALKNELEDVFASIASVLDAEDSVA